MIEQTHQGIFLIFGIEWIRLRRLFIHFSISVEARESVIAKRSACFRPRIILVLTKPRTIS